MEIIDLSEKTYPQYLVCLTEWNQDLQQVKSTKDQWYRRLKENGLRTKIAVVDDVPAGMIEYMPAKNSCVEGENLYVINCIWVQGYEAEGHHKMQGKGIGKALLQAAEEDVKNLGMDGLAAWGIAEKVWMNAFWFEKQGYKRADQYDGIILVWKTFNDNAVQPKFIKREFKPELMPGKVKVTSFFSGQCPAENFVHHCARKAAGEYNDRIIFEEIDMSEYDNRAKYGFGWKLFVDDENVFQGYPPTYDQIKQKIEEHLKNLNPA